MALLARLAVDGPASRTAAAALLWPDSDEQHARGALRRTISVLNKGLGGTGLIIRRTDLELDPRAHWCDVTETRELLEAAASHGDRPADPCPECVERLERVSDLHRGEFLAGFSLRDSSEFDSWQEVQAEELRGELARSLDRLTVGLARRGEMDDALTHARRRLSLDPLHEPAYRRIMLLHAWTGHREDAVRAYRECVTVLDRELGVSPLEETTGLYEAIVAGRTPPNPSLENGAPTDGPRTRTAAPFPPVAEPAGSAPGVADSDTASAGAPAPAAERTPFVARDEELSALLEAYTATASAGGLAVVEGEGGIGKTRLLDEFAARLAGDGARTITVRCFEGEAHLAYAPLAGVLRQALAGAPEAAATVPAAWRTEAARLVPELRDPRERPPESTLDSPEARRRFLEGVRQTLSSACRGSVPALIVVDDLHWADEATIEALTYLVHRLTGIPALLAFAWRTEQISAGHPLRRLLAEFRSSGNAVQIELQRFDDADVRALLDASDGVPAGLAASREGLSDRLFRETEGLPLFVVEYLHALNTDEREPSPGRSGEWQVPAGVRELLRSRLAPLSEAARQVLTAAAVIGRSFALDTVTHASGRSEEETVAALEELVEAGIVREVGYQLASTLPSYDFHHDKLRHIVYEEASLGRRRLLHGRVADSLMRSRQAGRGDVAVGLAARHLRLAGRESEAAERFVAAAERARRLSAHAEALGHFRAALALGYPDTGRVREAVGDLYTLRGEYLEAVAAYQTAAAQTEDPVTLARLEHKLGLVHERRGNWEAADAHFAAGLQALPDDAGHAPLRVRLYADRSLTAHRQGRSDDARTLASTALDLAEATGDAAVLAQAHNVLGMLARTDGDLDRAFLHLRRSHDLAQDLDEQAAQVAALNNLALAWVDRGDLPQALEIAKTALALGRSHGDRHREAALLNNVADLLHRAGQREEAMVYLKEAVAIFTEIGEERNQEPEIWKLVEW